MISISRRKLPTILHSRIDKKCNIKANLLNYNGEGGSFFLYSGPVIGECQSLRQFHGKSTVKNSLGDTHAMPPGIIVLLNSATISLNVTFYWGIIKVN